MHRTDAADLVAVKPTKGGLGTVGYHTNGPPGTVLDAYFVNAVQEELVNCVLAAGITLDTTGDVHTQVSVAVGAGGMVAHATTTGSATTNYQRAVIASSTSQASGDRSVAMASLGAVVTSANAAALACYSATADLNVDGAQCAAIASSATATFTMDFNDASNCAALACSGGVHSFTATSAQCAMLACSGAAFGAGATAAAIAGSRAQASATLNNVGTACAMLAVQTDTGQGADIASGAEACAMLACADGDHDVAATNVACAMVGCVGGAFSSTAKASAIIASGYNSTVADRPNITSNYSAAIGCTGDVTISGSGCIALASAFGTTGLTITDTNAVVIYSGTTEQIKLDAATGRVTCQQLRVDVSLLGAGTNAPTMINLPGATDGTQDNWLPISLGGTTYYIPVWTA